MKKDMCNKIEDAYCVFWVDNNGDEKWEVPQAKKTDEGDIYFPEKGLGGVMHGQLYYLYDMVDVNTWIKHNIATVTGQIGVARVRKVVKVDLTEQIKC